MGDFFKSARFKILIAVLVLLLAFTLRAAWTGGLSPFASQVIGVVVTPLQRASSSISNAVTGYFQRYVRADEIAEENERLRAENNELRQQMVDYEQYKLENETFKRSLGIKEAHPDFELEPAAVIIRDPDDRFYGFTIDKGTADGVALRDPVICAEGLVGVVKEVGLTYAKVVTILDPAIDVGVYDSRTRDIGIVTGSIDLAGEGRCKLTYLPRESGAAAGDTVVTSGGSIYPKGLIVGEIAAVADEAGGISQYAVVQPTADIRKLTDVMVVKSFHGQEEQDGD